MPSCLAALRARVSTRTWQRGLSTRSRDAVSVNVRCGSGGFVTVDLYNVTDRPSSTALIVHVPSFPPSEDSAARLPDFLQDWPVASINYRWGTTQEAAVVQDDDGPKLLRWPIPVHDTAFAFRWILENLAPSSNCRRDIYVYGSHLGASLATSLSLTETRAHDRFGIRGFAAYNGIYNWTMFLPDHRINRANGASGTTTAPSPLTQGAQINSLRERLTALFETPSNLFDPFASPSLFFHNPGLLIPQSFYLSTSDASMIDAMTNCGDVPIQQPSGPPRRSRLVFPPRKSTLKIPEALLLYDSPPLTGRAMSGRSTHTFEAQVTELADLMRRSIDGIELKERAKWDEDIERWAGESERRVQAVDVGQDRKSLDLDETGQAIVLEWLRSRI